MLKDFTKEKFDIIIQAGQSNAEGYGFGPASEPYTPCDKVYYLKRIVGLPGDTIAFYNGELYVNYEKLDEPYVKYLCDWNLAPRVVKPGHYYVVGDNRSQHIRDHKFGQVHRKRIDGAPLW